MCAIAGFYNGDASYREEASSFYEAILNEMNTVQKHRGPDENGIYLGRRCGLSHSRLSIIDPAGGGQPMSCGSCHLVYNGELYNTEELRRELTQKGCQFRTSSDTEIILLGMMEYGPDYVSRLDGIFAVSFYDEAHETLYLFRDSFGVKPLFYTNVEGTFVFSSEIKGLFCYPNVEACIDRTGLNTILGLGPAREPGNGVFRNIHEVKPGTYLMVNRNGIHETIYWRLESRPHEDDYETTIEKASFLITDAIKRQMVSDVPICTFLSGGVDSSLVSSVCAAQLKRENRQLSTYSFEFTENDTYFKANSFQPSLDRPYVDRMVSYLGSDHHYLECDQMEQVRLLEQSVSAHDLPCMADVDSSLLHFCSMVGRKHKVVLTGECADEIFGGYPWFHKPEFLSCQTFPWTRSLEPRKELLRKEVVEALDMDSFVERAYREALNEIPILPNETEVEKHRRQIGYLNIRFFMQTLLNRMDRTSMYSSLEARVPFADRALVSYIFNVPWEMKAKDGIVKNVLRQAARGMLPDEILFRKKSPYPKTYHPQYEQFLIQKLTAQLEDTCCPLLELVDKEKLYTFMGSVKDYGQPWYGQLMAGPQMLAYLLQINDWLKKYNITIIW